MIPAARALSHAGGVVYQLKDEAAEYLLIRPKSGVDEWLLPKGHIERGEMEENTALREVTEETGVVARIVRPLGDIEFALRGKTVVSRFFLMEGISEGSPTEQREHRWFPYKEALDVATHSQSRRLLEEAERTRLNYQHRTGRN
jgi:ADP-ribose pyrophosphatase YjhB (NUDIX family)